MPQADFNIEVLDRFPLLSQRGNFSGKASEFIKSVITGPWWRSDPSTGKLPDTVERNNQFFINQGPVDLSIINAKSTSTPTSLLAENIYSLLGTYLPRNSFTSKLPSFEPSQQEETFEEVYIWHPFTTKAEPFIEFSIIPTKY